MLSEGADVPGFELPALVDGEKRRVALSEYLGDDVVIIVFYPADFNPACDEESCDLDELDLFTMQKDVTILGISPDSVYSHRAFAAKYDLNVPLLSDTDGEVAQRYDIEFVDDIGQSLIERAVVVVDHDGTVTYSWRTDDMTELPRVEEIQDALAETGADDTAFARYRVGHAHYIEGRRAFTSAMESFENTEWVMAQHDFQQAREEFEEAADRFDTATRFVDDESLVPIYEGANEKATALWQAADWLTQSASAYSSGSGSEGQELREDAEIPMSTVREYREPPDPDEEWPPEMADLEKADTDDHSILPTEADVEDATLEVDIDEEAMDTSESDTDDEAVATPETAPPEAGEAAAPSDDAATDSDDIDDDELAEIQAELAANNPDSEPSVEEVTEESTAIVEAPPMGEGDEPAETAESGDEVPEEPTSIVDPPTAGTNEGSADGPADEPVDGPAESAETTAPGRDVDADGTADEPTDAVGEAVATADGSADAGSEAGGASHTDTPTDGTADDGPTAESDGMETDQSVPEADSGLPDEAATGTASGSDGGGAERPDADSGTDDDGGATDRGKGDDTDGAQQEVDDADGGDTDADGETDDDSGSGLQLELAEPDPDPIDADGSPADEAQTEPSGADESAGASGSNE